MLLYHYCSTDSFLKIVTSRSIRLSMLNMSNDHLEGRWVHSFLERELSKLKTANTYLRRIMDAVEGATGFGFAAGFCMSEHDDQLSQWRGYADDGFGFSIGFRADYLDALGEKYRAESPVGFIRQKIRYEESEYRSALEPILGQISDALDQGAFRWAGLLESPEKQKEYDAATEKLFSCLSPLIFECHTIKNPAFKEESEWRLVSMLFNLPDTELSIKQLCEFGSTRDRLVPYRKVDLRNLDIAPIATVVMGPRNITNNDYLMALLEMNGFHGVEVCKSSASYR